MSSGPDPVLRANDASPGVVLGLIRSGRARTRADLVAVTGLARSTVVQRVDALLASGLVREAGGGTSTGGRPPQLLELDPHAGLVLAADLGAGRCTLTVTDLGGEVLAERSDELAIALGPDYVLGFVQDGFDELLAAAGRSPRDAKAIGIGVPGPVEFATGQAVAPPIMPGWHGVSIPDVFADRFDVPVVVDNDVNIMALGEHRRAWPDCDHLLYVKVATGIGCGIVVGGQIHRGAQGAAGDIGHIRLEDHDEVVCACGNTGCLEALASGSALARQLTAIGYEARNARDVVRLVQSSNSAAIRLVRTAGRRLGDVLAALVNFFNPRRIVIGGDLAVADEPLLAGTRESIYRLSPPLATRHLEIGRSVLGDGAGIAGAAYLAIERALASEAVDAALTASAAGR